MKFDHRHVGNFIAHILIITAIILSRSVVTAAENVTQNKKAAQVDVNETKTKRTSPFLPVHRINLRVHLKNSSRDSPEFIPIFTEINEIWLSQAGICFEIHTVDHDTPLAEGLDMWFSPYIGGYNGYYDGQYIQMTDDPVLGWAPDPAKFSAARTAAHELGHALDLPHRQDSDNNLMRSKTFGWQLNKQEVETAREAADEISHIDNSMLNCNPPQIDQPDLKLVNNGAIERKDK